MLTIGADAAVEGQLAGGELEFLCAVREIRGSHEGVDGGAGLRRADNSSAHVSGLMVPAAPREGNLL